MRHPNGRADGAVPPESEWVARLSATGISRNAAVADLHELMLLAARTRSIACRGDRRRGARHDEVVHSAADEANPVGLVAIDRIRGSKQVHDVPRSETGVRGSRRSSCRLPTFYGTELLIVRVIES
ncbi:hypothetical protein [Agromyces bauzanensis]